MIVPYRAEHFAGVAALWDACFPDDPPRNRAAAAIAAKLAMDDGLLFVAEGPPGEVQVPPWADTTATGDGSTPSP